MESFASAVDPLGQRARARRGRRDRLILRALVPVALWRLSWR
ncbi:MAG: hypothetical protein ACYDCL_05335 [Myxococcales bacterium]